MSNIRPELYLCGLGPAHNSSPSSKNPAKYEAFGEGTISGDRLSSLFSKISTSEHYQAFGRTNAYNGEWLGKAPVGELCTINSNGRLPDNEPDYKFGARRIRALIRSAEQRRNSKFIRVALFGQKYWTKVLQDVACVDSPSETQYFLDLQNSNEILNRRVKLSFSKQKRGKYSNILIGIFCHPSEWQKEDVQALATQSGQELIQSSLRKSIIYPHVFYGLWQFLGPYQNPSLPKQTTEYLPHKKLDYFASRAGRFYSNYLTDKRNRSSTLHTVANVSAQQTFHTDILTRDTADSVVLDH